MKFLCLKVAVTWDIEGLLERRLQKICRIVVGEGFLLVSRNRFLKIFSKL